MYCQDFTEFLPDGQWLRNKVSTPSNVNVNDIVFQAFTDFSQVKSFDFTTNTWTVKESVEDERFYHDCAVLHDECGDAELVVVAGRLT